MNSLQKEIKNTFFQTLEDLKTKKDFETFFNDFLDEKELKTLTKRLAIAYWIKKGRDINNIKTNLKVTNKEINETKNKLGSKGYKLAIKLIEAEEWANKWTESFKKLSNRRIKSV